jgi:predicted MFS family arabinose efflux permease
VTARARLVAVKLIHTAVWAFFVAAIAGVPLAAWLGHDGWSAICAAVVAVEAVVLAVNGMRCPLTDVAGQFTEDRRDNFDIYLPEWLARHNKGIFGTLYVAGCILAVGWHFQWWSR